MQQSLLAGGALFTQAASLTAFPKDNNGEDVKLFHLNQGIHDGMFRNHAQDFVDQIKFAYSMGFRSIEDNGMIDRTPEQQKK